MFFPLTSNALEVVVPVVEVVPCASVVVPPVVEPAPVVQAPGIVDVVPQIEPAPVAQVVMRPKTVLFMDLTADDDTPRKPKNKRYVRFLYNNII